MRKNELFCKDGPISNVQASPEATDSITVDIWKKSANYGTNCRRHFCTFLHKKSKWYFANIFTRFEDNDHNIQIKQKASKKINLIRFGFIFAFTSCCAIGHVSSLKHFSLQKKQTFNGLLQMIPFFLMMLFAIMLRVIQA